MKFPSIFPNPPYKENIVMQLDVLYLELTLLMPNNFWKYSR